MVRGDGIDDGDVARDFLLNVSDELLLIERKNFLWPIRRLYTSLLSAIIYGHS